MKYWDTRIWIQGWIVVSKQDLFPYFEYSTTKLQRYSIKVLDTAEKAKVLAK